MQIYNGLFHQDVNFVFQYRSNPDNVHHDSYKRSINRLFFLVTLMTSLTYGILAGYLPQILVAVFVLVASVGLWLFGYHILGAIIVELFKIFRNWICGL